MSDAEGTLRSLASGCCGRCARPRRDRSPRAPAARSCRSARGALLESVPTPTGLSTGSPPRFDRPVGGGLLLVGVAERHPVAVFGQHRVQVLDARQVVSQLGLADLHHERRRICVGVAIRLERAVARRRRQLPRIVGRSGSFYIINGHAGTLCHPEPDIYCQCSESTLRSVRAARALEMLLILQRRGRTTASDLAERLEVTERTILVMFERTILRDVEVLSEAGVPIFTVRGAGGGIELMDGFQTHLTGLTTEEAGSLFLVGQPLVAHRLGLGAPTRCSEDQAAQRRPAALLAAEADRLSTWFLPRSRSVGRQPDPARRTATNRSKHPAPAQDRDHDRASAFCFGPAPRSRVEGRLVAPGRPRRRRHRRRVHRQPPRHPPHQSRLHDTGRLRPRRVLEAYESTTKSPVR